MSIMGHLKAVRFTEGRRGAKERKRESEREIKLVLSLGHGVMETTVNEP